MQNGHSLPGPTTGLSELGANVPTDAAKQADRPRGTRSFLTWSFFLAQMVAAGGVLSGSATAAEADDGASNSGAGDSAAAKFAALPSNAGVAQFTPEGAAVQQAQASDAASKPLTAANAEGVSAPQILESAPSVAANVGSSAGGGGGASGGEAAQAETVSEVTPDTQSPLDLTPIDIGSDIAILLPPGVAIDLGLDAGPTIDVDFDIDLGQIVDAGVDLNLDSGLGIDLALGNVIDLNLDLTLPDTSSVLEIVSGLTDNVLDTVTGLPVVDAVADTALNVAADTLATVTDVAQTVTSLPIVDAVSDTAFSVVGDTFATVTDVAQTVTDFTSTVSSLAEPITGSGGVLTFAETTVSSVIPVDSLFDGQNYTPLNLALQASVSAEQSGNAGGGSLSSLTTDVVDLGATPLGHDSDPSGLDLVTSIIPTDHSGGFKLGIDLFA